MAQASIEIKSPRELELMREAGRIAGLVLARMKDEVRSGITSQDLDQTARRMMKEYGVKPAFLGYRNYPAVICVSINHEVVHGIPSAQRSLREGDLVSVDLGVIHQGYYGDVAATFPVGSASPQDRDLMDRTQAALMAGVGQVKAGNRLGDVSNAIESSVKSFGYGIVRDFVGHGIGRQLHEEPQIPNYGNAGTGPRLVAGMCLALEPMINLGTERVKILADGWTVVTEDGKRSAHFEHTVAVTEQGPEILTKWENVQN